MSEGRGELRGRRRLRVPRLLVAALVGITVLSGCAPNAQPPAVPAPTVPSKVFNDQELMAIGYATLQERGQNPNFMDDTQVTRTAFDTKPFPLLQYKTEPTECSVFHPPTADEALKDLSLSFAVGVVPLSDKTDPTSRIRFTIRSAEPDRLLKADFDYSDELVSRCAQFEVSEQGQDAVPQPLVLLKAPAVGERAYALMGRPEPSKDATGVGLRVLAGTVSISMFRAVPSVRSESDAQPTLDMMASVARELIHQSLEHPPIVTPPPANAQNPQQLTDLLQTVTGPSGTTVDSAAGTVIYGAPQVPMEPCTYSDGAYYSALMGSTIVRGEFPPSSATQGSTMVIAGLTVELVSMPSEMAPPFPFDRRAADLRDCTTIRERVFGEGTTSSVSQWASIQHPRLGVSAESAYATAHLEYSESGIWHLLAGARRGRLSVELATIASEGELQLRTDEMAAVINQVFAKAGQ